MSIRIYLVEDHQMTLVGLKLLLEKHPELEIVGESRDGASAVSAVLASKPDVVLMDIGLPEMDGIEATQRIKSELPETRIMMLTSKESETDVFAALGAGADAYCLKGIPMDTLFTAIQAVNEGTAWLDPAIAKLVLSVFSKGGNVATAASAFSAGNSAPASDKPCPLTDREMEVLQLIVEGLSNPEIAERLYITKATAKAHVHSILQKLCVDDRTQAAVLAMRQGYVSVT
jgi:two-component system, NarL family, response regulator LiaR